MLTLNTFQNNVTTDFNEIVLNDAIMEITNLIKANATTFRLLIDITSENIDYKLYKNAITYHFMKIGYKVVNFPTFIFIDWSRVNIYQQVYVVKPSIESLGDSFTAFDLYASITNSYDLRKISHRTLEYHVNKEIKRMTDYGLTTSVITFGLQTIMEGSVLNNMFAPELALYASRKPNVNLTFIDGGNLKITIDTPAELYTDIPLKVLFGTNMN